MGSSPEYLEPENRPKGIANIPRSQKSMDGHYLLHFELLIYFYTNAFYFDQARSHSLPPPWCPSFMSLPILNVVFYFPMSIQSSQCSPTPMAVGLSTAAWTANIFVCSLHVQRLGRARSKQTEKRLKGQVPDTQGIADLAR